MSYREALTAAGAEVLEFKTFGSYSGRWYAIVRYNGETGVVADWYGSCTICDAYQAEFEQCWSDEDSAEEYEQNLAAFGGTYLDAILPPEHFIDDVRKDSEWDFDAANALEWLETVSKNWKNYLNS